ncbi:adenylate/guanylate cyclase domain-containing protein [Bradyrhizobium embrapense]|uniref:adenylate/guanylate cyclase domain-containing protein n=1 Tax=Bradyrhizobium embrapense TaxID=630921 RepID=UPI00067DA37A|nr:adenylate/guanylate cyclase domain-containing protein [Bradyrhizobium embrapense]
MTTAESVERRLAAVLAADVAGYSRLMGADEVGTLSALKVLRRDLVDPEIAAHKGRIVKTTGDGVLVEFASSVDAVTCAITIQRRMADRAPGGADPQLQYRIGINIGDIIVDFDDIFGDGVNVAARLEGIAEPGGICVSSSVYEQVRGKVNVDFVDRGEQNLKNICHPTRAYTVCPRESHARRAATSVSAPRLSVVVLPFTIFGEDPAHERFADGLTESLTTDLSRINGSHVVARNTAFSFKGESVDVRALGRDLNVRYALEGSVQSGSNRLRVNVQLIDAATGNHLWAERFDKPVADPFDMQDEIVARLANALSTQLIAAEARRAEAQLQPDVMDLYLQGVAGRNRGPTPEHLASAKGFFERALALEPDNVEALVGTAYVEAISAGSFVADDRIERLSLAEAALVRALSLVPDHAQAHMVLGFVQISTNRAAQGIAECQQSLSLDRNLAAAHAWIGIAKVYMGRADETEAHIREALRLSPRDAGAFRWLHFIGVAKMQLNADSEAVAWLRRGLELNRNYAIGHFRIAAALARLGHLDQARAAVKAGLALDASFTIRRFRSHFASDDRTYLSACESACEAMRMAGIPEG